MSADATRRVALEVAYGLRVCVPGQIETYDHKTQRASVLPLMKDTLADGRALAYPVIDAVPVIWPRGTTCSLTMPLERGDGVLLLFADRALERWLSGDMGKQIEAGDPRAHDLSDCIAIPGLYPFTVDSLSGEPGTAVELIYQPPTAEQAMKLAFAQDGTVSVTNTEATITMAPDGTITINSNAAMNVNAAGTITITSPDVVIN